MKTTVSDASLVPSFKASVCTYPHQKRSVFKTVRYQKALVSEKFTKASVLVRIFGRFRVDV